MSAKVLPCRAYGALLLLLGLFSTATASQAGEHLQKPTAGSDIFSARVEVLRIRIVLPEASIASLRRAPRTNVVAVIQEGSSAFSNVLVHLKGSTGSFRAVDEKPSLTLNFRETPFHGLRKVHLNNSVEDPTYLNEYLGSELFCAAGLPAARVTHATVEVNGRNLGLYVLKEGFSEGSGAFQNAQGELYEPDPGHDVNEPLRMVFGGEARRSRLQALASVTMERDLAKRWQGLQRMLDTERFCAFMALEVLLNHRDGYCMGRNNFRLFHDAATDRFEFIPHGMDQLFGKADAALLPRMSGMVAAKLMETPEGRALYKAKIQQLTTNVFRVSELNGKIDAKVNLFQPVLERQERQALETEVEHLKERITARHENVMKQIGDWRREQVRFVQGRTAVTNWAPVALGGKGHLKKSNDEGHSLLLIEAEPGSVGSWKSRVLLPKGKYRLSGFGKAVGVKTQRPAKNFGARLRIPGQAPDRSSSLAGSQPWTKLEMTFEVKEAEQPVELLCELRADEGRADFRLDSLILEQIP